MAYGGLSGGGDIRRDPTDRSERPVRLLPERTGKPLSTARAISFEGHNVFGASQTQLR